MANRLETISENLSIRLSSANSEQQRKVSFTACKLALQITELDMPIITESLEHLRQKKMLTHEQIKELNKLTAEFDEKYFDIQDNADTAALQMEALRFFSQARALSALSFAGGEDALVASLESVYEASMAFDDNSNFISIMEEALS